MLKSSILSYHASIKNSIKSSSIKLWILFLVLLIAALFISLLFYELEIAGVIRNLFPPVPGQDLAFYLDIVYLVRTEILWLGFFILLTLAFVCYSSTSALNNFLKLKLRNKAIFYMMLITFVYFVSTIMVSDKTLEKFPNSSDEYAYLFQAEMFSRGKLWEPAHDLPDFFYNNNIAQFDGVLVSRFPPGWPLVLSQALELGLQPSWVNPVLGLITLVVFYFFARRYYGELVAVWSLLAVAFTGYYIFNSASFFSHTSCLLTTLLFVYCIHLYLEKRHFMYGLLAGLFIGFIVMIGYYTAALIFLPFLVCLTLQYRFQVIRLFCLIGLGSIPCLAFLYWYNYSLTGSAFIPVTLWAYPDEELGFVKGHTFLKGLEHWLRWILMFFYWCSPGLLILYFAFLWRKMKIPTERWSRPQDYTFIALFVGYFFYYEIGGNQYGPRFLFEAFPFLVLFVFSKALQAREKWATALVMASLVFGIVKLPSITNREAGIVDERQDLYDLVEEHKISNAVVIVAAPTSLIRPMPVDDLTRNDSRFENDVIYALHIPKIMDELMAYYSDRSFYQYIRDPDHPQGRLLKIR